MIAAGKKKRLKMKNPTKLWPFRRATRAGQNARAIQAIAMRIQSNMMPTFGRLLALIEEIQVSGISPHTGVADVKRLPPLATRSPLDTSFRRVP